MATPSNRIDSLMSEYSGGVMYGGKAFSGSGEKHINTGFIGSANVVNLDFETITAESPGCYAAPTINILASESIFLGVQGETTPGYPVRIYAPSKLKMKATHIHLGELKFLVEPEYGYITCKKLTLTKYDRNDDQLEMVESWLTDDNVEVVIVKKS